MNELMSSWPASELLWKQTSGLNEKYLEVISLESPQDPKPSPKTSFFVSKFYQAGAILPGAANRKTRAHTTERNSALGTLPIHMLEYAITL